MRTVTTVSLNKHKEGISWRQNSCIVIIVIIVVIIIIIIIIIMMALGIGDALNVRLCQAQRAIEFSD